MNSSARVLATLVILLVLGGAAHAQYMGNSTATPTLPAPPPPGSSVYGKTYNDAMGIPRDPLSPLPPNSAANPYGRYGNPYSPDSIDNTN